ESGRDKSPNDARFPSELAGVAYKQQNFAAAKRELHAALRLKPTDSYARDFLATIYFLEGNLEAALEHWNQMDKPRLNSVSIDPLPLLDQRILGHRFAFTPPQVLSTDAFLTTTARLGALGVFSHTALDLAPSASGTFDATIHVNTKNGFGDSWTSA